jgi:hypothetical protein
MGRPSFPPIEELISDTGVIFLSLPSPGFRQIAASLNACEIIAVLLGFYAMTASPAQKRAGSGGSKVAGRLVRGAGRSAAISVEAFQGK